MDKLKNKFSGLSLNFDKYIVLFGTKFGSRRVARYGWGLWNRWKNFANQIIKAQTGEINMMKEWLKKY